MKKIEIVSHQNDEVVDTIEIGEGRDIDKVDAGLNINLNHEAYYTRIVES